MPHRRDATPTFFGFVLFYNAINFFNCTTTVHYIAMLLYKEHLVNYSLLHSTPTTQVTTATNKFSRKKKEKVQLENS